MFVFFNFFLFLLLQVAHAESALRDRTAELERQRQRERQCGGDVLRTERDVDRQRNRLALSESDAKRAEDRLKELERLLEVLNNLPTPSPSPSPFCFK